MNKTVSINLGGMFFHIDEDAYQKLNRYFDAIKRSLSPDGKDEIMSDIEARIAELLTERIKLDKQVVGTREIEEIITIMGKPEDYRIDEEAATGTGNTQNSYDYSEKQEYNANTGFEYYRTKKFYRDTDNGMIAGVCAGLGHYVRLEPLWIRIFFILLLIGSAGTASIVYLVLWIIIPQAITTTEKLEMMGEPINISNIEKKVREEFAQMGEKIKNVDYEKLGNNVKTGFERAGSGVGSAAKGVAHVLGKILGAFITLISGMTLLGFVITFIIVLFTFAKNEFVPDWYPFYNLIESEGTPLWITAVCVLLSAALPMLGLFLLGLKILFPNSKSLGGPLAFTLLAFWIASIVGVSYFTLRQSAQYTHNGKVMDIHNLDTTASDTLNLKFTYNHYLAKSVDEEYYFQVAQDSSGRDVLLTNDVHIYILKAEGNKPYVQIEKIANGSSTEDARENAAGINYSYKVEGNSLVFNNYFTTDTESKMSFQRVEIYVFIPEGFHIKADSSVRHFDDTDNSFFNLRWDNIEKNTYRMESDSVRCINCNDKPNTDINNPDTLKGNVHLEAKLDAELEKAKIDAEVKASIKEAAAEARNIAKEAAVEARDAAREAVREAKNNN